MNELTGQHTGTSTIKRREITILKKQSKAGLQDDLSKVENEWLVNSQKNFGEFVMKQYENEIKKQRLNNSIPFSSVHSESDN